MQTLTNIALIIHPKNETGRGDDVKWDEEYTLVVSDWYHRQHYDLLEEFMSWKNPTGAEPVPGMFGLLPLSIVPPAPS